MSASILRSFVYTQSVFTPPLGSLSAVMPSTSGKRPGTHTNAALQAKSAAKAAHQVQLDKAVALVANGTGGACKIAGMVEGCTRNQIAHAIHLATRSNWRPEFAIMTDLETDKLVKWILACAANDNPATESEVSEQVTKMLQCRRLANRHAKNGKPGSKTVPLTPAEERLALKGGVLSHTWFQGFYASNPSCKLKTAHKQESKRVGKQREDVVERHFHGEFGLTESLKQRGIMDPDGVIVDKRRLLNGDEMPAFLDFVTHNQKAIGEAGKSLQKSTAENRECASVNMAGDLGGFVYGPQYLVARKHMQASYGDCTEPWEDTEDYGELCHDDKIYLLEQRSTFSLVSLTDKGVQTGDSFVEFLQFLRLQIDARNVALVRPLLGYIATLLHSCTPERPLSPCSQIAAGHTPIEFPVVYLGDNHGSRFHEKVLQITDPNDPKFIGILLDFEESNTSQFLQMWDQINKAAHASYNKGKDEYKKQYKSKNSGEEPTIGVTEFFEIWGGSPSLQLPGVWFHWVNTAMMLAAWRKVGFAGGRIDTSLIEREHFIDRVQISPNVTRAITKKIDDVVQTPPGMRTGSLAAVAAKLEAAVAHASLQEKTIEELESAPFDPETVPFLMKPKALTEKKKRDRSQADMSLYEGGSASLRNVRKTCEAKRDLAKEKAASVAERKEERAGKKSEAAAAAEQVVADFERCAKGCSCGQSPCPMAGMKACGSCKAAGRPWIKPRVCVVRECVAARKGPALLALTYTGAPAPVSSPARLMFDGMCVEEDEEDTGADEVMPAARQVAEPSATLCDWACASPEMTEEEALFGYCSARRCKAKLHHFCFLHHAGEAGEALSCGTRFCRSCWAKQ